jgi:predicted nucleic-acid-binding protein
MLAIDTNVVVRFLTDDHPQQSPRARRLVDGNEVWVSMTVLLETEWVLRSVYRFPPAQIIEGLRDLAGLPRVTVESPALVARAMGWCAMEMDFAEALHLSAADHCEAFVTFDADLAKVAKKATGMNVREP